MTNFFLYMGCVLIWGTTWYAITLQLGVVAPEVSLIYRFSMAVVLLLIFALATRRSLRLSLPDHGFALLQGLGMFGLNYLLIYYGTVYLTSGMVAVLFTTLTFMNLAHERVFFGTPLEGRVLVAAIMGLAGIAIVFYPELAGFGASRDRLIGLALVLIATYGASLGNMVAIRNTERAIPVVAMSIYGMGYGTLFLLAVSVVRGQEFLFDTSAEFVFSLLYLGIFGTAVAFVMYLVLIRRVGGSRAAYTSVLIPVVALAVSTFMEDYLWTPAAIAGVILVLGGHLLVLLRRG